MPNQNHEQIARDNIDKQLGACGCSVQNKSRINLQSSFGVTVCNYQADIGPADYLLWLLTSRNYRGKTLGRGSENLSS
jgi:type I restriction enzyme, R subunit